MCVSVWVSPFVFDIRKYLHKYGWSNAAKAKYVENVNEGNEMSVIHRSAATRCGIQWIILFTAHPAPTYSRQVNNLKFYSNFRLKERNEKYFWVSTFWCDRKLHRCHERRMRIMKRRNKQIHIQKVHSSVNYSSQPTIISLVMTFDIMPKISCFLFTFLVFCYLAFLFSCIFPSLFCSAYNKHTHTLRLTLKRCFRTAYAFRFRFEISDKMKRNGR